MVLRSCLGLFRLLLLTVVSQHCGRLYFWQVVLESAGSDRKAHAGSGGQTQDGSASIIPVGVIFVASFLRVFVRCFAKEELLRQSLVALDTDLSLVCVLRVRLGSLVR